MLRALDLYCCSGGSAAGLHYAGFSVIGVDIVNRPNYPFEFYQSDALEFLDAINPDSFDFIWASPPCQAYSWSAKKSINLTGKQWPDLVAPTREKLKQIGLPYIIENVVGAPLINPITLCGRMFDLLLIRHRLFECSFPILAPPHPKHGGTVRNKDFVTVAGHGGDGRAKLSLWQEAMGIDWMTKEELTQAIPPAYSKFLGKKAIDWITKFGGKNAH